MWKSLHSMQSRESWLNAGSLLLQMEFNRSVLITRTYLPHLLVLGRVKMAAMFAEANVT